MTNNNDVKEDPNPEIIDFYTYSSHIFHKKEKAGSHVQPSLNRDIIQAITNSSKSASPIQ